MGAPVKHTCPNIDKAIKHLKNAYIEIKDAIEDKQTVNSISFELDTVEEILEDVRSANHALREWGYELEKANASLESDLEDCQQNKSENY